MTVGCFSAAVVTSVTSFSWLAARAREMSKRTSSPGDSGDNLIRKKCEFPAGICDMWRNQIVKLTALRNDRGMPA